MNTLPVVQSQEATTTFNFGGFAITCIAIDNFEWFIAKEVCNVLGYASSRSAVENHVRPQNKKVVTKEFLLTCTSGVHVNNIKKLLVANNGRFTIVNEPGLYSLIFRSRKPEAERFADWVYQEVLPSIRKTGRFSIHPEPQLLQRELIAPLVAQLERLEEAQLEANARGVNAGRPNLDGLIRPQLALDNARYYIHKLHIFDEELLAGTIASKAIYAEIIDITRNELPIRFKEAPPTDLLDRSYCYRLINERKRMLGLTVLPRTKPALTGNKYQMPSGVYIH